MRTQNDARVASHNAWVARMNALEMQLRVAALAEENLALRRRVGALR